MTKLRFNKSLYSKIALLKAAYNFTDAAYVHLDADRKYYYVALSPKDNNTCVSEDDFLNEILAQSVRHEIYKQTKNIRELMYARALATSVVDLPSETPSTESDEECFGEDEILKDWFADHEETCIE